jgi:pimeloyl-ACP methyl ester carboxylesterase
MRYLNEVLSLRPSEWVSAISAPTLYIVGALDTIVKPEAQLKAAAGHEGSQTIEIANTGHYPYLTHSSEFNATLVNFLREISI